jgi:hypothetical protein
MKDTTIRQCRICGKWKPLTQHDFINVESKKSWCVTCRREYNYNYKINLKLAKRFMKDSRSRWDYQHGKPSPDREVSEI